VLTVCAAIEQIIAQDAVCSFKHVLDSRDILCLGKHAHILDHAMCVIFACYGAFKLALSEDLPRKLVALQNFLHFSNSYGPEVWIFFPYFPLL
jgi:hypothetical protein